MRDFAQCVSVRPAESHGVEGRHGCVCGKSTGETQCWGFSGPQRAGKRVKPGPPGAMSSRERGDGPGARGSLGSPSLLRFSFLSLSLLVAFPKCLPKKTSLSPPPPNSVFWKLTGASLRDLAGLRKRSPEQRRSPEAGPAQGVLSFVFSHVARLIPLQSSISEDPSPLLA